jgi:transcriptional regulator with XRE-family HTH domain
MLMLTSLAELRYAGRMNANEHTNHMTPSLARAARAILNWSMEDLAERSGVSPATIRGYENGSAGERPRGMNKVNKVALARAFLEAGVEFIDVPAPGLIVHRPELLNNPPPARPRQAEKPSERRKR